MKKLFTLFFVTLLAFVFVACKEYAISVNANDLVIELTEGESKNVAVQYTEGETLSWVSSADAIATVADGKITALKEGEATITVTIVGHEEAKATISVKVLPIKVSEVKVTGDKVVFVGNKLQLSAEVTPANAKDKSVTWSSSDTSLATVDANGLVTALKEGNVEITAAANDGSEVVGKLAIEVKKEAVTGIEVAGTATMEKGATQTLQVSIAPDAATYKDYTFASSDEAVLTVSAEGVVTAVAAGTATVTVTSVDNAAVKDTLEITVVVSVASITISNAATMNVGDAADLACTVAPEDATNKEVEWSSSDATVLEVADGKVKALKAGTAKLVATAKDGSEVKAELEVTVSNVLVSAITVNGAKELVIGTTTTLTASVAPENATNKAFTWSSSNEAIATVSAEGVVTGIAAGTVKIIATANDGSEVKGELEVEVKDLPLTTYVFLNSNEETTVEGLNLKFGYNLFAKVEDAVSAVAAGGTVVLFPGAYVEDINLNKSVTLQSLSGELAAEKDVTKAAVVTGKVYLGADNTTVKGLTFTGDARVLYYTASNTTLKNFKFENNYVYDTTDTTVAWKDTRYSNGVTDAAGLASLPGFISLSGSYAWNKDTVILNNKFENVSDCNVYVICTDGITIEGNEFVDCDRDAVRLDYNNNIGNIVVKNNKFTNVKYNGVYLRSYGAGGDIAVVVEGNYFKNVGTENVESSRTETGAFATAAHQEATNATFKFQYNIFEKCDGLINIRGNVTNSATWAEKNITFTLDVSYNAFILNANTDMINNNFFGSDNAEKNFAIGTFNNNFYGTDFVTAVEMTDANFENILAKDTTTYANIALLEQAVIKAKGTLPAYTIEGVETSTVVAADALENDTYVVVEGQVIYVYTSGFMVKDATGVLYVYTDKEVSLGDKVKVYGIVNTYNDAKQIGYATKVEVVEKGTYTYNFTDITADEYLALELNRANIGKELKITGNLVASGNYINIKVCSKTIYLSMNNEVKEQLAAYIDSSKTVTLSVVTYYKKGTSPFAAFAVLDTVVPSEGLTPSYYVVDPSKESYANRVKSFADLTGKIVDGTTIYVAAGEYADNLTISANNVSIYGANEGVNPNTEERKAESVFTGAITVTGSDVTIDGISLSGNGQVLGGGSTNLTLKNLLLVNYGFSGSTDCHFLFNTGTTTGLSIVDCRMEKVKDKRQMILVATDIDGLTITGCEFYGAYSTYNDGIKFTNTGAFGAKGEVNISRNVFEGFQQYTIWFAQYADGNFVIEKNTFKDCGITVDAHPAVRFQTYKGEANGAKAVFNYNELTNLPLMFRIDAGNGFDFTASYNVVNSWYEGATVYAKAAADAGTVNAENNYWGVETLDAAKLSGFTVTDYYKSVEELKEATKVTVVKLDLVTNFATYAKDWDTSYTERVVKSTDIACEETLEVVFSRANKQTSTITTMPVIATKSSTYGTVYVTISNISGLKGVEFELVQWTTKTFADIHIEYTTDGTTWTACSDVITTPGVLASNASLTGATAIRLSVSSTSTSNVQVGLASITLNK